MSYILYPTPNVNIRYFSYNKILLVILRQIKMSSPNLNNLIIVGCLLCYSSVIILGLDSSLTSEPAFRYICTVKVLSCKLWQTVSRLAITYDCTSFIILSSFKGMGADGRLHSVIRVDVLQDVASALHLHKCSAQQKGL